jgi:hypothetical protein
VIRRVLSIALASVTEALRARTAPLVALVLLAAVPLTTLVFADDAPTRAWLARSVTTEGLRVLLPVGAIIGGGFLLKPGIRRGWTVLPARRAEYFMGAAMAGTLVLALVSALFAAGGLIGNLAFGEDLAVTRQAAGVDKQRERDGRTEYATGRAEGFTWANPQYQEELLIVLPARPDGALSGTMEFRLAWTGEAAPRDAAPVAISVIDEGGRHELKTTVLSRYRVRFEGEAGGGGTLVVTPVDPVLIVGTTPDRVRLEVDRAGPAGSIAALWFLCLCAAVLCLCAVLLVRALATAPTAVLAGLLLLSVLTLLPNLSSGSMMARDRRAAVERQEEPPGLMQRLEQELSSLPQLHPEAVFDDFLAARAVPGKAWTEGAWRLLAALVLLPGGALLFRLRQIAK